MIESSSIKKTSPFAGRGFLFVIRKGGELCWYSTGLLMLDLLDPAILVNLRRQWNRGRGCALPSAEGLCFPAQAVSFSSFERDLRCLLSSGIPVLNVSADSVRAAFFLAFNLFNSNSPMFG